MDRLSRRSFVGNATALAAALALDPKAPAVQSCAPQLSTFYDVLRKPDKVCAYLESQKSSIPLSPSGISWQSSGIEVRTEIGTHGNKVLLTAPLTPLTRIHLRWNLKINSSLLCMGDAWERSYGDLAWRSLVPERVLPWYFATHDHQSTHGYGVCTGAAAFCFWQLDSGGISLWLDVSNGGSGVLLGQRELHAATIVTHRGRPGEHPFDSIIALCRAMCPNPRLPRHPVFGTNDWYYAYGKNSAQGILRDTELIVSLSPKSGPLPFSVIDDGWGPRGTEDKETPARFPDMALMAEQIRSRGARPGIWIRPLEAHHDTNPSLLLPLSRFHPASPDSEPAYDPTIPEALQAVLGKVTQVVTWKYDLIKHDYTTYDLLGQWGFDMGAQPARSGWHFNDRTRTTAEIVLSLYKSIRSTAGDPTLILGCNTVGHLTAGLFELQRTGDDTSGQNWERTRRMGINTLAYRLPQHRTFFDVDADCVGLTAAVPWNLNRQWMDLIARSGTSLFISPSPDAIGPEQKEAIREGFAIAASSQSAARPTDWLDLTTPERWTDLRHPTDAKSYNWCDDVGCDPFPI